MHTACKSLVKLRQKAYITIKKQAQVVHTVAQHGKSVWSHAERKPDVTLRIKAHVSNHIGMNLAGASDFEPTASQWAAGKLNVNLGTGLREWKEAGAKPQHQVFRFEKNTAKISKYEL